MTVLGSVIGICYLRDSQLHTTYYYSGSKLFEFLIESLRSGNTHIRFQALLAVQRVVNYEDTSVDLKESLEDTQFVHPNVCRVCIL